MDESNWTYTIRLGVGDIGDGKRWVWQIVDDLGHELAAGHADDVQSATTEAARCILNVHDDADTSDG